MIDLVPLPPEEAIEYFNQKGYAIGFDHHDVWQAEHQASFTVAKVMQQDILEDIRKEIATALTDGVPYEQFAKTLTPTLQAKGWWGRKEMTDPLTGEVKDVQLGSPRRLKVIYDTNLRTSHSEGQWQRIQDNKDAFPYLEYDGKNSADPNPDHSAWDNMVLPVDHPFWQEHFPVKAYGCKCRAIPRTESQLQRLGHAVGPAPEVPTRPYVNSRTGEIQQIPAGVNPSFHYPPGGRRAGLNRHLIEKLESVTPQMARASIADLVSGPTFATWYQRPAGAFALAHLERSVATRLGANTQLVSFSEDTLAKQLREHPEITLDEYANVQRVIDKGLEIPGNQANTTVYLLDEIDGYVTVIKVTRNGKEVYMTSMRRLSSDQAKRDEEIKRLMKKKK